jgi:hypothetical protein
MNLLHFLCIATQHGYASFFGRKAANTRRNPRKMFHVKHNMQASATVLRKSA